MKIRKSLTAVGAALLMVGANAYAQPPSIVDCGNPASPEPEKITSSLINLADYLRKETPEEAEFGPWPYDPIWQKRGAGSYEVHASLARKLYEERDFVANPDKPRFNKNNEATGAAWDVRNGKYDAAVDKLLAFNKDAYKSRLNVWEPEHAYPDFENALDAKNYFLGEVSKAVECVCKLTECTF
jgi:hypothetical protein